MVDNDVLICYLGFNDVYKQEALETLGNNHSRHSIMKFQF
jgi:hypothetical protein